MTPADFRLLTPLPWRQADGGLPGSARGRAGAVDLEAAIAGYWCALAMPLPETLAPPGGDLLLRRARLDGFEPGDDPGRLVLGIRCRQIAATSIDLEGVVFRDGARVAAAEWSFDVVDATSRQPQPVAPALRAALLAFEAGEPMVTVRTGRWADLGRAAGAIRTEVFVTEQGIPAELEWDEADAVAVHALAENRLGAAVGTARLLSSEAELGKIGRMAVRQPLRGRGIGRLLLDALVAASRKRGDREVWLHAQRSAEGFYQRAGFVAHGEPFEEAGLPHVAMVRRC